LLRVCATIEDGDNNTLIGFIVLVPALRILVARMQKATVAHLRADMVVVEGRGGRTCREGCGGSYNTACDLTFPRVSRIFDRVW